MYRGTLFALVAVMAFTVTNPGYTMQLFNLNNPSELRRGNVAALKSPHVSPLALPIQKDADKFLLQTQETKNPSGDRKAVKEIISERTAHTKTFLNSDGTKTMEYLTTQRHFKESSDKNSQWKEINNSLEQKRAKDNSRYFEGEAGKISSSLKRLSEGISVDVENKKLTIKPLGTKNVQPEQKDDRTVIYREAWPGVDIEYELRGESVKEVIIVKNKQAPTTYNFSVDGGKVVNHPTRKNELAVAGLADDYSFSALTLDVNGRGVISEERVTQSPTTGGSGITVRMYKEWLKKQPDSAFPMRIDPTLTRQSEIQYRMYKSDGFSCNGSNCLANYRITK